MKTVRARACSRVIAGCLSLMLVLVIVVAGCGGGDGDVTGDGGGATQVKDGASVVRIDSGGFIEIPEGALPKGAEVSIEPTRTPVLPDGVEPVGEALAISATAELTEPATLHLPVPAGVGNASNLVIIRVESDGTTTFLMTSVEGDELVAATPGFSTFSVAGLIEGRSVLIFGKKELFPGERGRYHAVVAPLLRPLQVGGVEWNLSGAATLIDESEYAVVVQAGDAPGKASIIYEFIDLTQGRQWFGARSIDIKAIHSYFTDDKAQFTADLTTVALLVYAGEQVSLTAGVAGSDVEPPITWTWDLDNGETGSVTTGKTVTTFPLPSIVYNLLPTEQMKTYNPRVTATDSQGHSGKDLIGIRVYREPLAVVVNGPQRLSWDDPGVSAEYTASATGGESLYSYSWSLAPGGDDLIVDDQIGGVPSERSFTFDQPGEHRLSVVVEDFADAEAAATLPIMVEGGEPLSTHMLDLPATAEPGETITVSVQVRGGVLLVSGKKGGYEIHFNWGDGGETVVQKNVGLTRTPYQGTVFTLSHPYAKADTYTVSVEAWDATGSSADDWREITIEEGGGDTDGGEDGDSGGNGGAGMPTEPFFVGEWHFVAEQGSGTDPVTGEAWSIHAEGTFEFKYHNIPGQGTFSYEGTRVYLPSGTEYPEDGYGDWEFDGTTLDVEWVSDRHHITDASQPSGSLVLTEGDSPYTLTLTR